MIRFIARCLSERLRIKIAMNCLLESALIRPSQTVEFRLAVSENKGGNNGVKITRTGPDSYEAEV